jgi:hypothetical protein
LAINFNPSTPTPKHEMSSCSSTRAYFKIDDSELKATHQGMPLIARQASHAICPELDLSSFPYAQASQTGQYSFRIRLSAPVFFFPHPISLGLETLRQTFLSSNRTPEKRTGLPCSKNAYSTHVCGNKKALGRRNIRMALVNT